MPALQDPAYETFAQSYALLNHAKKAAVEAGFAAPYGYTLSNNPEIQSRVAELISRRFAKARVSADRVIIELARIAFADIRDLYDHESGDMIPAHELDDDIAAAVAQIKVEVQGRGRGEDRETVVTKQVKLVSKMEALTLLAKHFKIVGDDSEGVSALANILADRLNSARARDNSEAVEARIIDTEAAARGQRVTYALPGDTSSEHSLHDFPAPRANGHPEAVSGQGVEDEALW